MSIEEALKVILKCAKETHEEYGGRDAELGEAIRLIETNLKEDERITALLNEAYPGLFPPK